MKLNQKLVLITLSTHGKPNLNMQKDIWSNHPIPRDIQLQKFQAEILQIFELLIRRINAFIKSFSLYLTFKDEELDCGKPVNFTYYDHLVGIQTRATHPHIPEPEVASTFRSLVGSKSTKTATLDIDLIERKLKKFKRDKPKSVDLYNQIGNFWRIKGDTYKSIECFRRALAVSPNNADILLNLARVLFNLQYLDDAIFLTRRSLEVKCLINFLDTRFEYF